jgi:Ran GTPase-activating protein (RanGAP) involved in mRNA processing and transport
MKHFFAFVFIITGLANMALGVEEATTSAGVKRNRAVFQAEAGAPLAASSAAPTPVTALTLQFLDESSARSAFENIARNRSLKRLTIKGPINSIVIEGLKRALRTLPRLTALDLSENNIKPSRAKAFAKALVWLPSLRDLGARQIGLRTSMPEIGLRILNLNNNSIGDAGMEALAASLRYLPHLTTLKVGCNNIRVEGAGALGAALRYVTDLTVLDLSGNDIEDMGALAIAGALQYVPRLRRLDLSLNGIKDAGALDIADSLHHVPGLAILDLRCNNISSEGVAVLREKRREELRILLTPRLFIFRLF